MDAASYDAVARHYRDHRRADPRIAVALTRELADARTVLNLGAGVGSYEPSDKELVAVEPSATMSTLRLNRHPVVRGRAEALPFRDGAFDCAMAVLTIHHWADIERGLDEALRVTTQRLVLLTWVGFTEHFWLLDYLPQIKSTDEPLFPSIDQLEAWMGPVRVVTVPIPFDCTDGFLCAYWRRPEAYLDERIRSAISTFERVQDTEEGLGRLSADLASGVWHERYGDLLKKDEIDFGYRVVASR